MQKFKNSDGKEFTVRRENIINPKTGESINVATGQKPILNPQGKQVADPLFYNCFPSINPIDVMNSEYPYLFFGSEFGNHSAIPLPTPYSENIDYINFLTNEGKITMSKFSDKISDPKFESRLDSANLDLIQKTIYKEMVSNITQNVLAIYNNNLRVILKSFLRNPEDENKLSLFASGMTPLDRGNYNMYYSSENGSNIFVNRSFDTFNTGESEDHVNERPNDVKLILGFGLIGNICSNISKAYYILINDLMNLDLIDFYTLGVSKSTGLDVPSEYMYSYGVDVVNEIANMECKIISNIVEMNVMNAIYRFNNYINNH